MTPLFKTISLTLSLLSATSLSAAGRTSAPDYFEDSDYIYGGESLTYELFVYGGEHGNVEVDCNGRFADLDVYIYDDWGNQVARSTSPDCYESVWFYVPHDAYFTVQIHNFSTWEADYWIYGESIWGD